MKTSTEVAELFEDAALWIGRRYDSDQHFFESIGIPEQVWRDWNVHDVLDTLNQEVLAKREGNEVRLGLREIAALVMTHTTLAFRAGYLYGKGEIGE